MVVLIANNIAEIAKLEQIHLLQDLQSLEQANSMTLIDTKQLLESLRASLAKA